MTAWQTSARLPFRDGGFDGIVSDYTVLMLRSRDRGLNEAGFFDMAEFAALFGNAVRAAKPAPAFEFSFRAITARMCTYVLVDLREPGLRPSELAN